MIRGYLPLYCQSIANLKAYSDVDTDQGYVNHPEWSSLKHNALHDLKMKVGIKEGQIVE